MEKIKVSEYRALTDLANAVVMRAFDDLVDGYSALRARFSAEEVIGLKPSLVESRKFTLMECRYFDSLTFFKSDYFDVFTAVNPEVIVDEGIRRAEDQLDRWNKMHSQYFKSYKFKEVTAQ